MIDIKIPSNISIAGATSSGKTYLTKQIIRQIYSQLDYLIVLSPTCHISDDWSEFKENDDPNKGTVVQFFEKDVINVLEELVSSQTSICNTYGKKELPSILIIIDDCVNMPILRFKGITDMLSTKARHLNISLFILAQRISAIPRTFRINSRYFILFNVSNLSEMQRFLEESVIKKYRKQLEGMIENIFDKPYNYILVDAFNPRISQKLLKNGTELII